MTILRKLSIPLAAIAMAGILQSVFSLSSLRQMNASYSHAVSNTARTLELSITLDRIKSDMYLAQRGSLVTSFAKDTDRYAKHKEEFAARARLMKEKLREIRPLLDDQDSRQLLSDADKFYWQWVGLYPGVLARCDANDAQDAQKYSFETVAPIYDKLSEALGRLTDRYRGELENARAEWEAV